MFSKSSDKFLAAIVAGAIVLVLAAIVLVVLRPTPSYRTDNTAEAATHNYLFALQQKDYARAYDYLSSTSKGRPQDADAFADQVEDNEWRFGMSQDSTTWAVQNAIIHGDRATVSVQETRFYGRSLFSNYQSGSVTELRLRQEPEGWKIIGGDSYWLNCWDNLGGCD